MTAIEGEQAALTTGRVGAAPVPEVLLWLDASEGGLSGLEASARLLRYGPNAVRTHRVSAIAVLGRQLRSAVLGLLAVTAVVFTTSVELVVPVGIRTLPAAADPHTAGDAALEQFVPVK